MDTYERFRHALRYRDYPRMDDLLAEDVTLHTLVRFDPFTGKRNAADALWALRTNLEVLTWNRHTGWEDPRVLRQTMTFTAIVTGLPLHGTVRVYLDQDGLIEMLLFVARPDPAKAALIAASSHALKSAGLV